MLLAAHLFTSRWQCDLALFINIHFTISASVDPSDPAVRLCCGVLGLYLAVQLLVQLTDALRQLGQLLSDDSMVNSLSSVRLHIKVLCHKIRVALCKHSSTSSNHSVYSHVLYNKTLLLNDRLVMCCNENKTIIFLFKFSDGSSVCFSASL